MALQDGGDLAPPLEPDGGPVPQPDPGDVGRDGCVGDESCSDGEICTGGVCEAGCRFDGACGVGEICRQSACVAGCRTPAGCPEGQTCRNLTCEVVGCVQDTECGGDARCVDSVCVEIGAADCEADVECGHRWRCSSLGVCFEGQCLAHPDCGADEWCREGICVARVDELGEVRFARQYPEHLADHVSRESGFYGTGGGLFNYDGDRDLDLFLGGWDPETDSPPCLYRNITRRRQLAFEPDMSVCSFDAGPLLMAGGLDVEGDRYDEALLLGPGTILLERFHPERSTLDLMATLDEDDPRRACTAGSYAATDLDLDGRIDVLVGCQVRKRPEDSSQHNIAFFQRDGGLFVPEALPGYELLANAGQTLALGVIDVNDDGLLDVFVINDAFVNGNNFEDTGLLTGTALIRNSPESHQHFSATPLGRGQHTVGSFMGIGNVWVDGRGEHLYISDYGPNRLIRFEEGMVRDIAVDLGVELGFRPGGSVYSWSPLVDDLDRNGLDDLFISQGMASDNERENFEEHNDTILLQTREGHFDSRAQDIGLEPPSYEDSQGSLLPFSSRGAAKADLDSDGYLDLIVAGLEGVFRFYEEQPTEDNAPDRCTLIPRRSLVPVYGLGYAVKPEGSAQWQRRDMQGQLRMGLSPWVLSSVGRGTFRFPSGGQVLFDCQGRGGAVVVEEPEWLFIERLSEPERVSVRLDAPWLDGEQGLTLTVAVRDEGGGVRLVEAVSVEAAWEAELLPSDRAVMVRIGHRWVSRWFPL